MQRDDRYYSFLYKRVKKDHIRIRRVEVSKRMAHSTIVSAFLLLGLGSLSTAQYAGILNLPKVNAQYLALNKAENSEKESGPKANLAEPTAQSEKLSTGGPDMPFSLEPIKPTNNVDKNATDEEKITALLKNPAWRDFAPSTWPHLGKINNEYGFRRNPFGGRSYEFHQGLDVDGEKGDPVVAPGGGMVSKAGWSGGYGWMITIDHGNGVTTRYGHLSKLEVQEGDTVQRGQQIGLVGSTGRSTGPHLHYEVRFNEEAINPRKFLPPEPVDFSSEK
jgi:murein DD-endopeptidase MepM/ murein hydrolase activator NlpD